MGLLNPSDISSDEDLARRVLVRARSIAPCLDTLDDERVEDAIAILRGVVAEIPTPGSRRVRSRSRNGTSITYGDISSAFTADDVASLRSLCSAAPSGNPLGSFPAARPFSQVWPEDRYT